MINAHQCVAFREFGAIAYCFMLYNCSFVGFQLLLLLSRIHDSFSHFLNVGSHDPILEPIITQIQRN